MGVPEGTMDRVGGVDGTKLGENDGAPASIFPPFILSAFVLFILPTDNPAASTAVLTLQ
jgi:hypothetical protein